MMFGLLDKFNTDDPVRQARLAQSLALLEAGGPSRIPVSLLQGLGMAGRAGLDAKKQAQQEAQRKIMQDMQLQQLTMQQEEAKRRAAQQEQLGKLAQSSMTANPMEGQADPNHWSGTQAWTPEAGTFDRNKFYQGMLGMGGDYTIKAMEGLRKPEDELMSVAPGASVISKRTGGVKFTAPDKEAKGTSDMQEFAFAQARGEVKPGMSFTDWMRANKRASASNVSVNMGQKGYENESKLRNDFKSEPIYKDFADMRTAHTQIKSGIAQGTPIGDVATATKIMKLLDPGSVVRESELAIAMSAAGRMDRLANFVNLQLKGEKLTPTQRVEFGALADELMAATTDVYNKKRNEYAGFGKRYGLDENVLGTPAPAVERSSALPTLSDIDAELKRRRGGK